MTPLSYTLTDIQAITGGRWVGSLPGEKATEAPLLVYDSRRIHQPERSIFIALKGKRDGHDYIREAYERGVRMFWVENGALIPPDAQGLVVDHTLQSLQQLAAHHRKQLKGKVIGLTGSNGKTVVKEWLGHVLREKYSVGRSPGSYNSQLGVALSILSQSPDQDFYLIEAGISRKVEMAALAAMIQPDIGIMTHFGDAHDEGFSGPEERLQEKMSLFVGCEMVFAGADDTFVVQGIKGLEVPMRTTGQRPGADLRLLEVKPSELVLEEAGANRKIHWDWKGRGNRENILLVLLAGRFLGMEWPEIQSRIDDLFPVSMRTEMLTDNPEITLLNDAYNADLASVQNAFSILQSMENQPRRMVVLSDLDLRHADREPSHQKILNLAQQLFGAENTTLIGPVFSRLAAGTGIRAYLHVDDFLQDFDYDRFRRSIVLLKGARRFQLERIIPYLSRQATATYFKINLDHLAYNYHQFRALAPASTRLMAMVKAVGYGSGDWEVSQRLEREGVDCLGVAYTTAGINLRTQGIHIPILVMNADPSHLKQLYRYQLEPVIYSPDILQQYISVGQSMGAKDYPVHLEVDTGMSRLGFTQDDLPALNALLETHPQIRVVGVMSHLAVADAPAMDAATHQQAQRYQDFCAGLAIPEGHPPIIRHLANTAGMIRFPEYAFDMVRVGIGLYGVSPLETATETGLNLKEIASLHSVVTQVHDYPPGVGIGYGASAVTERPSRIATVAMGYADGIRRSLSNGSASFLIRGQRAPIIGRVCMDMTMLDVTDIPGVKAGDEVVIIGKQGSASISVEEIAEASGTIAYEILVNIGQRVRRIYEQG